MCVCVCVCVCVCARARARARVCVCVRACTQQHLLRDIERLDPLVHTVKARDHLKQHHPHRVHVHLLYI